MNNFFIKDLVIPSATPVSFTFNIPIENKKVKGIFLYGDIQNSKIDLSIDDVPILPAGFDGALIKFNGYLSRSQTVLALNQPTANAVVKVNFTPQYTTGDYPRTPRIYFLTEQ